MSSQLVGLAMTRYVWLLQPMADISDDAVVHLIGPTIQAYLTGRLATSADPAVITHLPPDNHPSPKAER